MAHRNRWFTYYIKMVIFHGELLVITRWYLDLPIRIIFGFSRYLRSFPDIIWSFQNLDDNDDNSKFKDRHLTLWKIIRNLEDTYWLSRCFSCSKSFPNPFLSQNCLGNAERRRLPPHRRSWQIPSRRLQHWWRPCSRDVVGNSADLQVDKRPGKHTQNDGKIHHFIAG